MGRGMSPEAVNILRDILVTTGKEDQFGRQNFTTIYGDQQVGTRHNQVGVNFEYSASSRDVIDGSLGGGSLTHSGNQAQVKSGTSKGDRGRFTTDDEMRFTPGTGEWSYYAVKFDSPVAGNIQRVGLFDDSLGLAIGFDEDRRFHILDRVVSGETKIFKNEFNRDKLNGEGESEVDLDFQRFNLFRMVSPYLGTAPVYFDVYTGSERGWVNFHTRQFTDIQTNIATPNLPIRAETLNNEDIDSEVTLEAGFVVGGITGAPGGNPSDRPFTEFRDLSLTSGSLRNVLTLRSKDNFQNKPNRIKTIFNNLTLSTEGNKPVEFRLIQGATLGTSNFSDVDTANSVMEVAKDSTGVSGGRVVLPIELQKADSKFIELPDLTETGKIELSPGETLTIAAESSSSSDILGGIRWTELF